MIGEKLLAIQTELKAPKGQLNSYGNYMYRSCEDILEAVKPILNKYKCLLVIHDEVKQIGDRYYVMAEAKLIDLEDNNPSIINTAYAREEDVKKGMDGSQITGTASSYARKYALNGLFLIDDTKDADTDEHAKVTGQEPKTEKLATEKQIELLKKIAEEQGKTLDVETVKKWTMKQASDFISKYKEEKK